MRIAMEPLGQGRQVWRDKSDSLGGEAAEWALIAAMAGWVMVDGRFVVVDLDAELGGGAEKRLEFGGDRRVIGAGERGRGHRRRRRGGEKLNDERNGDEKCGQRRAKSRRAKLRATRSPLPLGTTPVHETRFFARRKTLAER